MNPVPNVIIKPLIHIPKVRHYYVGNCQ